MPSATRGKWRWSVRYIRPEIMLIKHSKSNRVIQIMDPDCAICSQPALARCECEVKGLDLAVRQAEQRMMFDVFAEIRAWVRGHAQDYILAYFSMLTTRRKDEHHAHITQLYSYAARQYHANPHPSDIQAADLELKRGIDEDWRTSVQRYPEVLEYFYGLVDLSMPGDGEAEVRDPPLSALGGVGVGRVRERKVRVRGNSGIRGVERERSRVRERSAVRVRERDRSEERDRREVSRIRVRIDSEEVEDRRRNRRSVGERDRGRDRDMGRERERERIERERERDRERERERFERFEGPPMMSGARGGGGERMRPGPAYAPAVPMASGYGYVQAPGY